MWLTKKIKKGYTHIYFFGGEWVEGMMNSYKKPFNVTEAGERDGQKKRETTTNNSRLRERVLPKSATH